MIRTAILIVALAWAILLWQDSPPEPNYDLQANCIAEYAYTHPGIHKAEIDTLAAALKECR